MEFDRDLFLPVSLADMQRRGWEDYDFLLITGDAYVDHPSFGPTIIGRLLEAEGYVSSVPGKGSFAAPHHQVDSARRDGLLRTFDETATELFFLGLSADALSQRLSKLDGGVRQ